MLRHFVLLLALLPITVVLDDETAATKPTQADEIAKLLDRIDQLEKRIKELEQQAAGPQTVTDIPLNHVPKYPPTQYPPYSALKNQSFIPNTNLPHGYPQQAPVSPSPYAPQTTPTVPYQMPYRSNNTVPNSWKPFNFNGMQYYFVPVNESNPVNRSQGYDKTSR